MLLNFWALYAKIRLLGHKRPNVRIITNKENNVFKDALGVKGLGFKHHGNHPCNHGSHYGNHHSNHHGNYNAEQLLFSCQFSKVSSCQVVRLSSLVVGTVLKSSMLTL